MRTTVTLDPDVEAILRRTMRERGITFKQALNDAVRAANRNGSRDRELFDFPTHDMGQPRMDLTKALRIAAELDDEEFIAKMRRGA